MHVLRRDDAIQLSKRGIFIAMHFPKEQPAGWYVGKPIESLKGCGQKDNFWVAVNSAFVATACFVGLMLCGGQCSLCACGDLRSNGNRCEQCYID